MHVALPMYIVGNDGNMFSLFPTMKYITCYRLYGLLTTKFNKMIETTLLQQAIDKWGANAQIDMIIEECAELILALQKMKRNYGKDFAQDEELLTSVCDEVADVRIMTEQAQLLFDKELIQARVDYKMNRLKDRLSEGVC